MNRREIEGLISIAVALIFLIGLLGGIWLIERRAKQFVRREKMAGRLPARRMPAMPAQTASPRPFWFVIAGFFVAFLPIIGCLLASQVFRILTPPQARIYAPPLPSPSQLLVINLKWVLLLAGFLASIWVLSWLGLWFDKRFLATTALSRAEELIRVGNVDEAIRVLREAIEAKGPSVGRLDALADCLMKQGQWLEAFEVSLDIEERRPLYTWNRSRKALALCKLGHTEEAIALSLRPNGDRARQLPDICAYCQILTDLGLYDRAWDQLRRAELIFSRRILPEPEASSLRESIDACRARLAEHFPGKKAAGFEEL